MSLQTASGPGGIPLLHVRNDYGSGSISLLGANVVDYRAPGGDPILWLSPLSRFVEGTAIRGGIPVCWPWFAKALPDRPSHGVARTRLWSVLEHTEHADGTTVALELADDPRTRALWPHSFRLRLQVFIGAELRVTLVHQNISNETVICSGALHAYLAVSDLDVVSLEGLNGVAFFDKVRGQERRQRGNVQFEGAIDRIYATDRPVELVDAGRRIGLVRTGSHSVVVWNPWTSARKIADLPDDSYRKFVCVEAANAGDDQVTIAPGEEHQLGAVWYSEPIIGARG